MTQDELDEIPEQSTPFVRDVVKDGRTVRTYFFGHAGALYQPPGTDEPSSVVDASGQRWILGYCNGVRYKRRIR